MHTNKLAISQNDKSIGLSNLKSALAIFTIYMMYEETVKVKLAIIKVNKKMSVLITVYQKNQQFFFSAKGNTYLIGTKLSASSIKSSKWSAR